MDNILCNGFCDVSQEEMMEINGGSSIVVGAIGGYIFGKILDWAFKPIKCY